MELFSAVEPLVFFWKECRVLIAVFASRAVAVLGPLCNVRRACMPEKNNNNEGHDMGCDELFAVMQTFLGLGAF